MNFDPDFSDLSYHLLVSVVLPPCKVQAPLQQPCEAKDCLGFHTLLGTDADAVQENLELGTGGSAVNSAGEPVKLLNNAVNTLGTRYIYTCVYASMLLVNYGGLTLSIVVHYARYFRSQRLQI